MSVTNRLKGMIKQILQPAPKRVTEFDYQTIPWIDKKEANIQQFSQQFAPGDSVPYDMAEKLEFWKNNGYVIFEQAIPTDWIDMLWGEVESVIDQHEKYDMQVRIDLPDYSKTPVLAVKDVPQSVLNGPYIKYMDFHNASVVGKKIMLHKHIVTFLEAVFNDRVVAMQSLLFKYGSQQPTHQDFAYVVSEIPSHLAAAWIALEDVKPDSGPLFYYPGSHTIRKFDFGNGIFFNNESTNDPNDFANYLDEACQSKGLQRETLLIKKGDLLIWHAALAHGGNPITNESQTRKSYVCHYSSQNAYKHHRSEANKEPERYSYNNADVFKNPLLPQEEDIFQGGEAL
ncbi:MAG: phytanoyl-CoA dioxygenase [Cytophagaceae bacterium]|nr:MAG: phytanoyl-CoA dioxygenase [Cytophagaceae bacterium]